MYLKIDRSADQTLSRQIYEGIKTNILTGTLRADEKLPSTRQLAKDLYVSRNIMLEVYDQLLAEGYIHSVKGSGTYVTTDLFLENFMNSPPIIKENIMGLRHEPNKAIIDFRTGVPNLSLFPKEKWGALYKYVCENLPAMQLDYHEPRGCYALRYALVHYLRRVRGVSCDPSSVLITTGAAQAFTMITKHFSMQNKEVLAEDPLSHGILDILKQQNMSVHPVSADAFGINTSLLPKQLYPSLIFTTPSHQFPTGSVLPIKRRIDLIRYAREKLCYIVEDDYDSEFRFEGLPIQSMQSLDPERVIYIGTFSKILCPALRLGYMIIPPSLTHAMQNIKYTEDIHSPVLEQLTLAKFIENGYLDTHIRKSKKFYHQKNQLVIHTLKSKFKDKVSITGHTAGIHLAAEFESVNFTPSLLSHLENNGVKVPTVEEHALIKGLHTRELLIGYGSLSDDEIVRGIDILYQTIKNCREI
ncbi:MAG: transcriptional regulator with domain and aminotransferase domain [Clostridia bacterium]|jgi:GntR family transcriptional regulator/MocR family aminotransferase|nr:transcriptional regulator with domain and aminotransferase domain [Clostridia bacterium]